MEDSKKLSFDLNGIQQCQQNRYPLLFIDKVTEVVPEQYSIAVKRFTYNEWFFPAHFEDDPNVPGFILVESLVQTFIMTFLCKEEYKGMQTNFVNINKVNFTKKVLPGDTMIVRADLTSFRRGIAKGVAEGKVNDESVCVAEFLVTLPDVLNQFTPKIK